MCRLAVRLLIVVFSSVVDESSGKHEFSAQGVDLHHLILQGTAGSSRSFQLFYSICVFEGVEGILATGTVG